MKRIPILLLTLGIVTVLVCSGSLDAAEDPILAAGFFKFVEKIQAPGFRVENVEGKQVKLEDFQGKVVMLFFWTTW